MVSTGGMVSRSQISIGELVRVLRLPKYWGGPDLRGLFGTVIENGGHSERWFVLVEGQRISFHRNHLAGPGDDGWEKSKD